MNNLFKTLFILFISISFAACSTDDDSGSSDTSGNLVGSWEMVSFDYDGSTSTAIAGQTTEAEFTGVGQNLDYVIEFSENPNEFNGEGSYDIELTTTALGQTSTVVQPINDASSSGTYTLNGNTISFEGILHSTGNTIGGDMTNNEATITELTDTTLRFVQETTQEQTQDGITISITLTAESVFTRI